MSFLTCLRRSQRGVTLIEFALVLPALLTFIVGITQLGTLFYVNSDLRAAVAEGARLAELYPAPSDSAITTGVSSKFVHLSGSNLTAPTVTHATDTSGQPYIEVTAAYRVPLNFIFFTVSPITLTETRRVYTQVENPYSTGSASANPSTSSGVSTTTTTSGGVTTTTTSSTSSGTTSASSTSASSTSASSTTTSASSTSSGTTTTTTSTGNNSNGNSNGNSDLHGNCKTGC